jgi:esterase/lipase
MCKIAEEMLPPAWVIDLLMRVIGKRGSTSYLGYLPIAPARASLENTTHKLPEKRRLVARCPTYLVRNPRLATARELIYITQQISKNLHAFNAPFLVVHGKDDVVTDPDLSVALYEESKSKDKSIRLYDGMWHSLTGGEADEDIDMVFSDMIDWILKRAEV